MKTVNLTRMVVILLLFTTDGILAQTIQSNLNQIELMKQFTGTWKGEMVHLQDISNPENAVLKWKFEFKIPDMIVQTALKNNKVYKVIITTRVK